MAISEGTQDCPYWTWLQWLAMYVKLKTIIPNLNVYVYKDDDIYSVC